MKVRSARDISLERILLRITSAMPGLPGTSECLIYDESSFGLRKFKVSTQSKHSSFEHREVCKPNCKPTAQHSVARDIANQDHVIRNAERERTLSCCAAHARTKS